jgi:hypothetical protein
MSSNPRNHTIARAVRIEYIENSNDVFIVFKIVDERFKQHIRNNWEEDVECRVIGKELVIEEE